ncbi:MAG: DUF898 family protein [Spirochaetales bacterium]|uniref:DUF898 family protein n=1 Tax=Candidatus Thalassospirochaeta sargassi TaxID=3119039 RepID=A0AAJ1MJV6_9SPIO|nr:DUF898 family protein [Spirochaetales bacterium]
MKINLKSVIEGRGFFKRYLLFLIPLIVIIIFSTATNDSLPLLSSLASIVQSYLYMLLWIAVLIYIVPSVSFRDEGFAFSGSVGEFAPKMLKWYLLTIITLGIYSPWMIRNLADYCLSRLSYKEDSGEFLSSPGKLLKYILLTLYLPLIILTVLFVILMQARIDSYAYSNAGAIAVPTFLFMVFLFLIIIPFMYYYFVWLLNIRLGSYRLEFRNSMKSFAGFLIPQLLLCLITCFIYYPAAVVKIYSYLVNGSVFIDDEGLVRGGFGFDGKTGKGWGLIWGQGLLTVLTAGIYGPWAIAKISNWVLNNTGIDEGRAAVE